MVFALRDQDGHAVVLPAETIESGISVLERGPGTNNWEEIDYSETSFFVHTAENIDLEVVFVLDFTNSMFQARLPDGRTGIDAMLEAFDAALAVLPSAHRVGVVEFHDRNIDPSVLSPLTTDRASIRSSVAEFRGKRLRSRFISRVGPAWNKALASFPMSARTRARFGHWSSCQMDGTPAASPRAIR